MSSAVPVVVFSWADSGLHDAYGSATSAAARALKTLNRENVSVVLCSSKTRAELELIQQDLGLPHPFVCENGAAAFVPHGYFGFAVPGARDLPGYEAVEFGRSYVDVVATLRRTAERIGVEIVGFNDMSVEQVGRECQLPILRARLAKLREFEEPFRILDSRASARTRLFKGLEAANLRCVTAGQYHHVGAAVDPSVGVNLLCGLYRRSLGAVRTAGIADSASDVSLSKLVDYQVSVERIEDADSIDLMRWVETITRIVRDVRGAEERTSA